MQIKTQGFFKFTDILFFRLMIIKFFQLYFLHSQLRTENKFLPRKKCQSFTDADVENHYITGDGVILIKWVLYLFGKFEYAS